MSRYWFLWWLTGSPFVLPGCTMRYCFVCCGWGDDPRSGYECWMCGGQGWD